MEETNRTERYPAEQREFHSDSESKEVREDLEEIKKNILESKNPIGAIRLLYMIENNMPENIASNLLLDLLENKRTDSEIKLAILDILSQTRFLDELKIERIYPLINDDDPEVRNQAVELLGSAKSRGAVKSLIKRLNKEKQPRVRHTIMAALANIGDRNSAKYLERWARSRDWKDRYFAADAIGMLANPRSVPVLLELLDDPSPRVREQAALSVGFFGNNRAIIDKLINLLKDESAAVRAAAVYTLGEIGAKEAADEIHELLKTEDDEDIIIVGLEALEKIGREDSIPTIINFLYHRAPEVYQTAGETLDVFPAEVVITQLIKSIEESRPVKYLLERIGKERGKRKQLEIPEWVESLINKLNIGNK